MLPEEELLKDVTMFQFLDDQERADLVSELETVIFPAGHTLFNYGDPGDALFVVKSGEVEIFFKNDTGERIVLELATRGHFFGELSLLDGGARTASAIATQNTEALRLERHHLEHFLAKWPHAAMALLAAMSRRQRENVKRLRHTATRNVNAQVDDERTRWHKVADWVTAFSGSASFIVVHVVIFGMWVLLNALPLGNWSNFDAYPYGFLNLAVSVEAIFLSVFVLLSQNRLAAKERVRSDIEYDVNLKAEMEIAHMHEKMDRLTAEMLERFERLQNLIGGPDRVLSQNAPQVPLAFRGTPANPSS